MYVRKYAIYLTNVLLLKHTYYVPAQLKLNFIQVGKHVYLHI